MTTIVSEKKVYTV